MLKRAYFTIKTFSNAVIAVHIFLYLKTDHSEDTDGSVLLQNIIFLFILHKTGKFLQASFDRY